MPCQSPLGLQYTPGDLRPFASTRHVTSHFLGASTRVRHSFLRILLNHISLAFAWPGLHALDHCHNVAASHPSARRQAFLSKSLPLLSHNDAAKGGRSSASRGIFWSQGRRSRCQWRAYSARECESSWSDGRSERGVKWNEVRRSSADNRAHTYRRSSVTF